MGEDYAAEAWDESDLIRLVAPNPSPMTSEGTNTYIIGSKDLAIIDPGPISRDHSDAILAAVAGRPVRAILVTHAHLDHSPAAAALGQRFSAPVLAYGTAVAGRSRIMEDLAPMLDGGEGVDSAFKPDRCLSDGDEISGSDWTLKALHTPGHMANHMCFFWPERGVVFTGDTVMGWATTLISPPDGDLGQFLNSLDRLQSLPARVFYPGHGPAIADPSQRCSALRAHRAEREGAILRGLDICDTIPELVAHIYRDTPPSLHPMAARNVLAHLIHLLQREQITVAPRVAPNAVWRSVQKTT